MRPDTITPEIGIPLALTLWLILGILTWKDTMTPTRKKLTTSQVAEAFGVTRNTVIIWADRGKLDHTRTLGGDRRFDAEYIERLVQGR